MPDNNDNQNKEGLVSVGNALDKEIAAFEGIHTLSKPAEQQPVKTDETKQATSTTENKSTEVKEQVKPEENKSTTTKTSETKKETKVDVSFDDYTKILNRNKDSVKPSATKTETKIETTTDIDPDDKGKPVRNLEGFSDQIQTWLKKMPYDAYEFFSKNIRERIGTEDGYKEREKNLNARIKELESGKEILPESYFEHPQAFLLSPEYNNVQTLAQTAKAVENHWAEQLQNFKEGKNWQTLVNDPKTGELVLGSEIEYDAKDEVYLMRQFQGASQQSQKWLGEAEKFISNYAEQHKGYMSKIQQVEKSMLPVFENKESVEYKTYENIKPQIKKWGISETNPAFNILTKAVALNLIFRDALTSMIAEQQKATEVKQEQVKAGPTLSNLSGGSGTASNGSSKKEVTMDDYNRILNPGLVLK